MRRIYCLYDLIANTFIGQIITDRHDGPVIRMFHDVLSDAKTGPGQHPADYVLLHLGSIADNGLITPEGPTTIATGASWAAAQQSA